MSLKVKLVDLMPNKIVKIFAAPYVAGDTEQAAVSYAQENWRKNKIKATIDLLGEEVTSAEEVEITVKSYITLIDLLGKQEFATVSLKPTQLGSHESQEVCTRNIERIAEYAEAQSIPVTIDMEDHTYTDLTLAIYKTCLKRFPTMGTVLQTRLFRTDADIKALKGLRTRVRLCIGIYLEPAAVALQKKAQMKAKLLEQAEILLDDGHYVELGTHDEILIDKLLNMIDRRGFTKDQVEFQMLMGVPRERVQTELLQKGYTVRYYVPYAILWKHATAYSKRRLAANPNMGLYVAKNFVRSIFKKH